MKAIQLNYIRTLLTVATLGAALTGWPGAALGDPAAATASPSASVSELLEQGIYNQETKGDTDAAILIYQQLIAEARANDSLAAQAEFRLGQCYLKENRKEEATAAFQKVVDDFPNETELVAKAREFLPGALKLEPAPWVDGERLQLKIYAADGTEIGIVEYRADLVESGTESIWRVGARLNAGQVSSVSSVDADAETFRPISSRWKNSELGEVEAVYHPGEVDLRREGETEVTTAKLQGPVIDNEEAMDEMRRLPLQEGYKTPIPVFSTLGGGEIPTGLEVTGKDTVQTLAGTFECYRVQLSVGQTFWFSTDSHRYLVQFQAGAITARMTSIAQRKPDEPVTFHDEGLGVSLTAPPRWVVCSYKTGQPAGQSVIRTYDPDADADDCGVRFFATNTLSADEQKSSKAWAEGVAKNDLPKLGADVKVRPDSWKDCTVSGRAGESFMADYTVSGKAKTYFALTVIGPKDSEAFVLICAPDKFDALKTQFDSIIASYQRQ